MADEVRYFEIKINPDFGLVTIEPIEDYMDKIQTIVQVDRADGDDNVGYNTLYQNVNKTEQRISFDDYTCDVGVKYSYKITFCLQSSPNTTLQQTLILAANELDYGNILLYDASMSGGAQIVAFNPNISSVRRNQAVSITQTLGGRYPIVRKNGDMDYYTFSLSGIISILAEQANYSNQRNRGYEERLFREKFVDSLSNGKIKLFKSGQEGLMLVRVTDVNLTPEAQLGRDIYSFSATITEVGKANIANLKSAGMYNIISKNFVVKLVDDESDDHVYFLVRG